MKSGIVRTAERVSGRWRARMSAGRWRAGWISAAAVLAAAIPASQAARDSPPARAAALYNLAGRPQAQFVWFPASPHPGETVLLGSISTDLTSPLVGYAWDLGLGGGFVTGAPTLYTRFS